MPTFESFMLGSDPFASREPAQAAQAPPQEAPPPPEFEWNSVAEPAPAAQTPADPAASFAELNDSPPAAAEPEPASFSGFQEIDFGVAAPAPAEGARPEQMLTQELESVDFYIEQGYADIARDTLDMLERQYGANPEIERRRALLPPDALEGAAAAATTAPAAEEAGEEDFSFRVTAAGQESNGSAPPAARPSAHDAQAGGAGLDPGLAAIFDEFREEVEDGSARADEDFETHYNLGLAYREMGLLDQAVEEFQAAAGLTSSGDGTPRFLQCCNLLGHCFMEKGMPRPASLWFKRGLQSPGQTEDEYQALRFELGLAYEQMGEADRAIEVFSEVYAIDVSYRGVAERLRELQKAVNRES